jgi:uncharacterized metal-binding protein YceD (DUF177 family)
MGAFRVNVADILGSDVPPRPVRIAEPVEWELELSRVPPDRPLVAELTVQLTSGGVLVRGTVDVAFEHSCRRCLTEFTEARHLRVAAMFERTPEDETYPIEGDEIDLELFLRDEVLLDLPMGPECLDGCVEVVTTPESDLNTHSPGDEAESGSPFAVLRDLFEPGD